MKAIVILALVAVSQANPILVPGAISTGTSAQYRSQDNLGNYAFGYNEDHATGGTFRREVGDAAGGKVGSYGLRDADGRLRIVNYVADDAGFRANIQSNEPGVEPKDPAAVLINKAPVAVSAHAPLLAAPAPAPVVAAPAHVATYAAPVAAPAHIAAPVAAPFAHYAAAPAVHHAPAFAAPHYAAPHIAAPVAIAPSARTTFTYSENSAPLISYATFQ